MSLDVYLETPSHTCPACNEPHGGGTVYEANITHNLGKMADAAGLYEAMWRPELVVAPPEVAAQIRQLEKERRWSEADDLKSGRTAKARDLIPLLQAGLARLRGDPQRYQAFNPENGWGNYDGLVRFTADYLAACEEHPDAVVRVSR